MFSVTFVCVSVCKSHSWWWDPSYRRLSPWNNALISESPDLESLRLVCGHIFGICRSSSYIKVIGSRSRSQEQKVCLCMLFTGGLLVAEKYSCFFYLFNVFKFQKSSQSATFRNAGELRKSWLMQPQTYKYLSRCRTSYSRCIISCSHW